MSEKEKVVLFQSFDGVELEGAVRFASNPTGTAVLLVHGIDSDRDEFGFYSRMANALADSGYPNLRFDWRCNGHDSARPIEELTLSGVANDISAADKYLREWSGVERMVVIAMSFGGGVAAYWARTIAGKELASVVLLAPVLNYAHDYLALEQLGSTAGIHERAAADLQRDGSLKTSGRRFSRAMICELPHFGARPSPDLPVLLMHGDADNAVPYDLSVAFAEEFEAVELVTVPGTDHGFATPGDEELDWPSTLDNHQHVYERIIEWLERL